MKHLSILMIGLALLSGCVTKPQCPPDDLACLEADRQQTLNNWAERLKLIATEGTPLAYYSLQGDKRDNFKRAVSDVITGLNHLNGDTITIDKVVAILADHDLRLLSGQQGSMYISAGKLLLTFVGGELSVNKPAEVELFRNALVQGLTAGYMIIDEHP